MPSPQQNQRQQNQRQTRWIGQTRFDCIDAKGKRFRLVARIGEPTTRPREGKLAAYGWCPVSMEPLLAERGIGGENQFQALCLAIDFIRKVLKIFVAQGGRVVFPGTQAPIDLDDPSFCSWPDIKDLLPRRTQQAKKSRTRMTTPSTGIATKILPNRTLQRTRRRTRAAER